MKKIFFALFFFLLSTIYYLSSTAQPAFAQAMVPCDNPAATNLRQAHDAVIKCAIKNNDMDSTIFNFSQITSTVDSLDVIIMGDSQMHPETNVATRGGGALAVTGQYVASLYSHPPASGINYMAQKFQKLNPVQPAYAQTGIGFDTLSPVQNIWGIFRNFSYVGFIIVFVVVGFMIMFRAHISPQAVATVQDSLPRIVIALVLVTFSYAIAGFMIDAMFVFLNIVINTLPVTDASQIVFNKSVFGVVWGSWDDTVKTTAGALYALIKDIVKLPFGLNHLIAGIGGGLSALVVGIAMLFIMFKVFLMLLMAYTTIIILTIVAPFFFLLQALPGNNSGSTWFKQMAANIAVFPVVAIMFVLAGYIGGIGALGGTGSGAINANPQGGNIQKFPLLAGDIDTNVLGRIAGIGMLLMTPAAAQMVKDAIGVKGGPQGAFAPGAAALGASAGFLGRRAAGTSVAQGLSDVMEERGRQNRLRVIERVPERFRGTPGRAGARAPEDIARTRLPH